MEAISLGVWDPPKYAVPRKLARKLVGGGTFFFKCFIGLINVQYIQPSSVSQPFCRSGPFREVISRR